jgi:glutamate synthase (NADPH/NADH) small chain
MPKPNGCPKISDKDFQARFSEAIAPLGADGARHEAARCLYCYDAPCIDACPTHIDIPSFIRKIATGNLIGSARTILAANPLGATCARVCPVENLCEGACVRNDTDHPVAIGRLQRHAMDAFVATGKPFFVAGAFDGNGAGREATAGRAGANRDAARPRGARESAPRVAVVGAGAAGLACAVELRRAGVNVVLFEGRAKAGGLADYGIVPWRLPRDVPALEVREVERAGAEIRTGVMVGIDVLPSELLADFDAVFLGVGLGRAKPLGVSGEELRGVLDALEFIEKVIRKDLKRLDLGQRVAVIGCGNTAMDAANCARKLGCDVSVFYRRTEAEAPAYPDELKLAKSLGVQFRWLTSPVAIRGRGGRVARMAFDSMRLGKPDRSGRRMPAPIDGGRFTVEVDTVIRAVGQERVEELLNLFGVKHARGRVEADATTRRTSNPKVWAGGDLVNGGLEVVNAVEEGKVAARSILTALGVAAPSDARLVGAPLEVRHA